MKALKTLSLLNGIRPNSLDFKAPHPSRSGAPRTAFVYSAAGRRDATALSPCEPRCGIRGGGAVPDWTSSSSIISASRDALEEALPAVRTQAEGSEREGAGRDHAAAERSEAIEMLISAVADKRPSLDPLAIELTKLRPRSHGAGLRSPA